MSDSILPCPFCNGENLGSGSSTADREGTPVYVYCMDCGCQGPWTYVLDQVLDDLNPRFAAEITGWNNRR